MIGLFCFAVIVEGNVQNTKNPVQFIAQVSYNKAK